MPETLKPTIFTHAQPYRIPGLPECVQPHALEGPYVESLNGFEITYERHEVSDVTKPFQKPGAEEILTLSRKLRSYKNPGMYTDCKLLRVRRLVQSTGQTATTLSLDCISPDNSSSVYTGVKYDAEGYPYEDVSVGIYPLEPLREEARSFGYLPVDKVMALGRINVAKTIEAFRAQIDSNDPDKMTKPPQLIPFQTA